MRKIFDKKDSVNGIKKSLSADGAKASKRKNQHALFQILITLNMGKGGAAKTFGPSLAHQEGSRSISAECWRERGQKLTKAKFLTFFLDSSR